MRFWRTSQPWRRTQNKYVWMLLPVVRVCIVAVSNTSLVVCASLTLDVWMWMFIQIYCNLHYINDESTVLSVHNHSLAVLYFSILCTVYVYVCKITSAILQQPVVTCMHACITHCWCQALTNNSDLNMVLYTMTTERYTLYVHADRHTEMVDTALPCTPD